MPPHLNVLDVHAINPMVKNMDFSSSDYASSDCNEHTGWAKRLNAHLQFSLKMHSNVIEIM